MNLKIGLIESSSKRNQEVLINSKDNQLIHMHNQTIGSFRSTSRSSLKIMIIEDLDLNSIEINETIGEFHEFQVGVPFGTEIPIPTDSDPKNSDFGR